MKRSDVYISKYNCIKCQSPVITLLNFKKFDFYYYCSNILCVNHTGQGEGVDQYEPEWCMEKQNCEGVDVGFHYSFHQSFP